MDASLFLVFFLILLFHLQIVRIVLIRVDLCERRASLNSSVLKRAVRQLQIVIRTQIFCFTTICDKEIF